MILRSVPELCSCVTLKSRKDVIHSCKSNIQCYICRDGIPLKTPFALP
jgi:hypothetical protein